MENEEDGEESPNSTNEQENNNYSLICGLPDDISLMCLARVPRKYCPNMKCVSKRWRDLICSEEWVRYRRIQKLDETWIYALCMNNSNEISCYVLDPNASERYWKLIEGFPPHMPRRKFMGFEALGNKLFFVGGCNQFQHSTDEVYSYDASTSRWAQATSLPSARYNFACGTVDEKLYAIGGVVTDPSYSHTWETFDPLTNCWTTQRDPKIFSDIKNSMVFDKKLYIQCDRFPVTPHTFGVAYEPSSGIWEDADANMVSGWVGPTAVVEGTLYVLDCGTENRIMKWHKESGEWLLVGRLPPLPTRSPFQLVGVGKNIFIVGRVLATVVINVDDLENDNEIILRHAIPGLLFDVKVISCKCLSI